MMAPLSILFGLLLSALGLIGYFAPETFGTVGEVGTSLTALIPVGFGVVLLVCGLIVMAKPTLRKHVMHAAALVGLLGAVGGFMPLMKNKMDFSKSGTVAGALMIGLCVVFVALCVNSFIQARKRRVTENAM